MTATTTKKLKSVGYYSECLNTGAEYAIREDGKVFSREKFWNDYFRTFTKSKWKRDSFWDDCEEFKELRSEVKLGFHSWHTFIPSTRLKLPQD